MNHKHRAQEMYDEQSSKMYSMWPKYDKPNRSFEEVIYVGQCTERSCTFPPIVVEKVMTIIYCWVQPYCDVVDSFLVLILTIISLFSIFVFF